MDRTPDVGWVYRCPMHPDIPQQGPGPCPHCGMALLPEGARFALFRHMISSPWHVAVMVGLMAVVMLAAMMLMR